MTRSGADDAPQSSKAPSGKLAARAWFVMFLGFAAVFLVGLCLFMLHSSTRLARLEAHYDRAAARTASQVGLRWESIVKRLTPLTQAPNRGFDAPASLEGDGSVEVGPCERAADGASAFVSSDQLALIKRATADTCGRVTFATLLNGPRAAFTSHPMRARRFEQVLLVDGEGRVLAAEQASPQLMTNTLPWPDKLEAAPAMTKLKLGATEYRAFLRPVRLFHGASDQLPSLFVCGLLRDEELVEDGRRVESSYALLGLFLLAMAVIGLPAAKLWLIGPEVRYRRRDVRLFKFATALGAVLSLVLILGITARQSLRVRLDGQLATVGEALKNELAARIEASAKTLGAFDEADRFAALRSQSPLPSSQEWTCEVKKADFALTPSPWNVIFRLDARGRQTEKYYRVAPTPCVEVEGRDYFRIARNYPRDLGPLPRAGQAKAASGKLSGAAEVVRSRTTGKTVLIVAMPERARLGGTVALETPLETLTRQELPRGVQTVVIDGRGRVMLHSDSAAFQEQSFFEDVPDQHLPALRAALDAKLRGPLSLEYLGAPSRVHVEPLQAGWTVITLAPEELFNVPTRQMVLLTLLSFVFIAACLPFLFGAFAFLWRLQRARSARNQGGPAALPPRAPRPRVSLYGLGRSSEAPRASSHPPSATLRGHPSSWLARAAGRLRDANVRLLPVCAATLLVTLAIFWGAYDRIAEDWVGASLHEAAQQRLRHPSCFGEARLCADFTGFDARSPVAAPNVERSWLDWMADLVTPIVQPEGVPLRAAASSLLPWSWSRRGRELILTAAPLGFELHSRVPALLDGWPRGARCFLVVFVLAVWLYVVAFALRASFTRLTFRRAVAKPGAAVSTTALLERLEPRLLVLHPQPELADQLRAIGVRELVPGAESDETPSFIAHAELYFREPEAFVQTLARQRGKLIVLSAVDWTRWLPPECRASLDAAFGDFEVIRGPGLSKWPASPTERRALASALWASCNDRERRLLARLALDGYVAPHPDNEPLVAHLRARGILRRDRLSFAEPHFRGYVRYTVSAAELRSSASAQQNDAWNAIRVPLSTAALLVLGFVSYMQPELAALGIPISSALAAARPLFKMLGLPGEGG